MVLGEEEGARGAGCHSLLLPPSIAKSLSIDDMETDATVVITRSHIAIILATNSALSAPIVARRANNTNRLRSSDFGGS
jgi:hypothetical protein